MNFRSGGFRRAQRGVTLDLTPLIDCIFQLLVFFLLTASFITTPSMGVDLPKASANKATSQDKDLIIVITRDGRMQFEGKIVDAATLLVRLKAKHKDHVGGRVLIQADTKAYHGNVVAAMNAAKAAGFKRFGVATKSR